MRGAVRRRSAAIAALTAVVAVGLIAFLAGRSTAPTRSESAVTATSALASTSTSVVMTTRATTTRTVTTQAPPTTVVPIVLTDPSELARVLQQEAQRLMGRDVAATDVADFVAQYHAMETDQQRRHARGEIAYATTPAGEADSFLQARHNSDIFAYSLAKNVQGLQDMVGGVTTTTSSSCVAYVLGICER